MGDLYLNKGGNKFNSVKLILYISLEKNLHWVGIKCNEPIINASLKMLNRLSTPLPIH